MDLFLPPISTLVFKKNQNLIWEIGVYFFILLEPKRERIPEYKTVLPKAAVKS